jgi:hypothetical protein
MAMLMFPDYLDGAKVLEYTEKDHCGFITDYDEDGNLKYCIESASKAAPDLGETTYAIKEISQGVDETIFDLSGYDIEKQG